MGARMARSPRPPPKPLPLSLSHSRTRRTASPEEPRCGLAGLEPRQRKTGEDEVLDTMR